MSSLISVIVVCSKNNKYLLRCINSIKRQTYTNREILLVSDDKEAVKHQVKVVSNLKEAVEKAKGEYVFFCSDTSILTANVLEELQASIAKSSVDLSCASTYVSNGADYKEYFTQISIFGKIFKKKLLRSISINENNEYGMQELIAQYLVKCDEIRENAKAVVYETNESVLNPKQTCEFEMEAWKRVFELIGTDFSIINGKGRTIKQETSDLQKNVEHKVSYLKNGDAQTFMIVSKIVQEQKENVKVVEVPKVVEKKVIEIQKESVDVGALLDSVSGDALISYVIGKYQNGNLGLKTIIKSFFAWMKYKF